MADFDVGDSVRLLKLDEWFFKGLEPDTVVFLRTCVGKKTKIRSFDDYGHAELEFEVPRSPDDKYQSHTVWIDQSWIEKV